jgi:hypothetical protein
MPWEFQAAPDAEDRGFSGNSSHFIYSKHDSGLLA